MEALTVLLQGSNTNAGNRKAQLVLREWVCCSPGSCHSQEKHWVSNGIVKPRKMRHLWPAKILPQQNLYSCYCLEIYLLLFMVYFLFGFFLSFPFLVIVCTLLQVIALFKLFLKYFFIAVVHSCSTARF